VAWRLFRRRPCVLARRAVAIGDIAHLRAPRVGMNAAFSSQSILAELVFGAYGLGVGSLREKPLAANLWQIRWRTERWMPRS
jgi:hypothetical protein